MTCCVKTRRNPVGTHDLCVRCVKGYSVRVLTGTDARAVRPYSGLHVRGVVTAGYTSRGLDDGLFVRAGREGERRQLADDLHRVDAQTDDRVEQVNDVAGGALLTAP